jgi:hypothetical protein
MLRNNKLFVALRVSLRGLSCELFFLLACTSCLSPARRTSILTAPWCAPARWLTAVNLTLLKCRLTYRAVSKPLSVAHLQI